MTLAQSIQRRGPKTSSAGSRAARKTLFGEIAERYRAMKRRVAEMLMRGDHDYAMLSALSQEIGRMRQTIRTDLQRRREKRMRPNSKKNTPTSLADGGGRSSES